MSTQSSTLPPPHYSHCWWVAIGLVLFVAFAAFGATVAAPKRVLLLYSFGHEFAQFSDFAAAGADGVVLKRAIATELLHAVDTVLAGQRYISPTVVQ